ncbi:MAG: hypothetical protein SV062_13435 [Thermodesulfobacteriota bacterium]|nr:hypothetical protein [Thermodesulfobacteriota bacterium]
MISIASQAWAEDFVDNKIPDKVFLQNIPKRSRNAITGSKFALNTTGMTGKERQAKALEELVNGNVPEFLRNLKPVCLSYRAADGENITAIIWVTPDYLAIGSDEDFLRIPLSKHSAVTVANAFDCILPTRKMVDAIYKQSTCHLEPDTLPPGPLMRSSEYYLKHREMIRAKRKKAGCALGELTSGHKKDLVLTNHLNLKPGRVAIYGWHRKDEKPIQPLSTAHGERYADYSHGVRLIYRTVWINGELRSILDVLQDPWLAPALTYEGVIEKLLKMLRLS